jgi:hypothetical protein
VFADHAHCVDDRAPDGNDLYLVLALETVGTITARDRL